MVGPWMTFHSAKERIVGGIAQEMVEGLMRKGASPGHLADSSDYVATITPFDPEVHKALLFEMMREAGVSLLLHAYFLSAQLDGEAVCGATFATVGGTSQQHTGEVYAGKQENQPGNCRENGHDAGHGLAKAVAEEARGR